MSQKKKPNKETQDVINAIKEITTLESGTSFFKILAVMLKHCGSNIKSVKMVKRRKVFPVLVNGLSKVVHN